MFLFGGIVIIQDSLDIATDNVIDTGQNDTSAIGAVEQSGVAVFSLLVYLPWLLILLVLMAAFGLLWSVI